jgi:geranylgeranyl pyrophosphate synthase
MSSFDITASLGVPKLKTYLVEVDDLLQSVIPSDNKFLYDPYSRILKSKSKRLRPSLVIAVAIAQGITISPEIISAASVVEMVHLASLIHDDIIDNAASRHGAPTVNAKEGLAQAIIVGDYLLAEAGKMAVTISVPAATCIGSAITQLCSGQGQESGDNFNIGRSIDSCFRAISGKTAALFSASLQLGGLMSSLDITLQTELCEFGKNFGIAFQLIDDLLDFISSKRLLGKSIGNDVAEGVYSYPLLVALNADQSNEIKHQLKPKTVVDIEAINRILFSSGAVDKTIKEIKKYANRASKSLDGFGHDNQIITNLANLPGDYFNWAIKNLVSEHYKDQIKTI